MIFKFQDPTNNSSPTLHEALNAACNNAQSGGGAFAFVTRGGVRLYMKDTPFGGFIQNGTFELVVGIDEVTNPHTLEILGQLLVSFPNLSVSAFAHNHQDSIFHPKFCWFKKNNGGTLIVGSGNLTVRGLRNNWEAFTVMELTNPQINEVIKIWNEWKQNCEPFFKPISDNDVILRVQQNAFRRRPIVAPAALEEPVAEEGQEEDSEDTTPWRISEGQSVLVAEIPRAKNRWNQGNFDQDSFENFFGSTRWNNNYRILLRVAADGNLEDVENRQAVSVKSHNWRFELGAAAGLNYPGNGRPTGVFIRVGIRMFVYALVMPGSPQYAEVDAFLTAQWHGRADRMRRVITSVANLRISCPTLSFWTLP